MARTITIESINGFGWTVRGTPRISISGIASMEPGNSFAATLTPPPGGAVTSASATIGGSAISTTLTDNGDGTWTLSGTASAVGPLVITAAGTDADGEPVSGSRNVTVQDVLVGPPGEIPGDPAGLSMTQLEANRVYQRSTTTGGANGAGAGTIEVGFSATNDFGPIEARLRDATTEAVIVDWTDVAAGGTAGSHTVDVPAPARLGWYLVDLRANRRDAEIVLGTSQVGMGAVLFGEGQSQIGRFMDRTTGGDMDVLVPEQSPYVAMTGIYTGSSEKPGWHVPSETSNLRGCGAAELLRLMADECGCNCGLVVYGHSGASITQLTPGGADHAAMLAVAGRTNGWEMFWQWIGGTDAINGMDQVTFTELSQATIDACEALNGFSGTVRKLFTATGTRYGTAAANVSRVRKGAHALAEANGGVYFEPRDYGMADDVHPSEAGNVTVGQMASLALRGDWHGPELVAATRVGAVITAQLNLSDGAALQLLGSPLSTRVSVGTISRYDVSQQVNSVAVDGSALTITLNADPGDDPIEVSLYPHPDANPFTAQIIDDYTAGGLITGRTPVAKPNGVKIDTDGTNATGHSAQGAWEFVDTFATPAASLEGHVSDSGHTWGTPTNGGAALIDDEGAFFTASGYFPCSFVASSADVVVETELKIDASSSENAAVLARGNAAGNSGYALFVTSSSVRFGRYVNGSYTTLLEQPIYMEWGVYHKYRMELEGSEFRIFRDGVLLGRVTDTTFTGAGNISLRHSGSGSVHRRSIRVAPLL